MLDIRESSAMTCSEQPNAAMVVMCRSKSRLLQLNTFSLSHSTATVGCQGSEQKRELIHRPAGRSPPDLAMLDLKENKTAISSATVDRLK